MRSIKRIMSLIIPALILGGQLMAEEWPGWRGLEQYGVSPIGNTPLHWSKDTNIKWKVPIPGEGHSSPIHVSDKVFVTTAYEVEQAGGLIFVVHWIQLLFVIFLMYHILTRIDTFCRRAPDRLNREFLSIIAFSTIGIILGFFILFGDNLFDYERCHIRRWIGSTVLTTICLVVAAWHTRRESRLRQVLSLLLIGFSIIFLIFVPSKHHAYRHGWLGTSSLVMYAIAAFPFFIGGILLVQPFLKKRGKSFQVTAFLLRLKIGLITIAILSGIALVILLYNRISIENLSPTSHLNTDAYEPLSSWRITIILAVVVSGLLVLRIKIHRQIFLDWLLIQTSIGFVLSSLVNLIEYSAHYSPYIAYELGNPRVIPVAGWPAMIGLGSCCLIFVGVLFFRSSLSSKTDTFKASNGLAIGFLFLALIIFLPTNLLATQTVFIRAVICFDKHNGHEIWHWTGLEGSRGQLHKENSAATPTPVTDGENIYAYFGSAGLVCLNLQGKVLWINDKLRNDNVYGPAVSPIISENRILVTTNYKTKVFYHVLDKKNGSQIWQIEDPKMRSSSGLNRPPLILPVNGIKQIVSWGSNDLIGFDLIG